MVWENQIQWCITKVLVSNVKLKPPIFDGKILWITYLKQFEAAAKINKGIEAEKATALNFFFSRGDALSMLQTISEDNENYKTLMAKNIYKIYRPLQKCWIS